MGFRMFLANDMSSVNAKVPGLSLKVPGLTKWVSHLVFKQLVGWNPDNNFSPDRIPVIAAHQPGGTSVMVMANWAQSVRTGGFYKYDYGSKGNMEVYGTKTPPAYNLKNLESARVAIFYGGADKLTTKTDVEELIHDIGCDPVYVQYEPTYPHLDFVWGDDAHLKIYGNIVDLAKRYYNYQEEKQKTNKDPVKRKKSHAKRKDLKITAWNPQVKVYAPSKLVPELTRQSSAEFFRGMVKGVMAQQAFYQPILEKQRMEERQKKKKVEKTTSATAQASGPSEELTAEGKRIQELEQMVEQLEKMLEDAKKENKALSKDNKNLRKLNSGLKKGVEDTLKHLSDLVADK
eukprot:CAMPEP_0174276690 /NCGR_PEP_ID=MMETSP0439-20130205/60527_1 /TAXON_ID=0 /ORGANISM="Stereomyxa ramosa, Strain Chinc5" /LENGTH=345 /DNA_ID=CAMNT_0015368949 /DNA_START=946 /DNA_END=1983 /DNA_ORIENTATION=-